MCSGVVGQRGVRKLKARQRSSIEEIRAELPPSHAWRKLRGVPSKRLNSLVDISDSSEEDIPWIAVLPRTLVPVPGVAES